MLRRYAGEATCTGSGYGYHDAAVEIGQAPGIPTDGTIFRNVYPGSPAHDDPRWPTKCACGYEFQPPDPWQPAQIALWRRADTGALVTLLFRGPQAAPPGAMWNADWMTRFEDYRNPDGRCLTVRLPDGVDWAIDGPARSKGEPPKPHAWTRTGEPPRITASPSILTPGYHGWLKDGVLHDA
jgi:hypothetical protein